MLFCLLDDVFMVNQTGYNDNETLTSSCQLVAETVNVKE